MSNGLRLVGRAHERRLLADLLDGVRQNRSGALVVRGDPGIGKTALLQNAVQQHPELHLIEVSGAETDMELAYAGVQQMCAPLLKFTRRLPAPQRTALEVALGLRTGAAPDRLLVGLAVLTLLAEAGADRPMLCLVDDAQWVDTASLTVLAIVARRLLADRVAIIFAARDHESNLVLAGLPEHRLEGLSAPEARLLLDDVLAGPIDERMRESIIAEAGGSPLALLELPKAFTPAELAGGYGLTNPSLRLPGIEQTYGRQLNGLPSATRLLLLIAAAEPAGRATWLWAAADRLGVTAESSAPAERADLVTVGGGLKFRHPLIRSAVYQQASSSDRRRVHGALADVIVDDGAREHRAWHRAQAVTAPDEAVAAELEVCASRAGARGGSAAAATFLARSAALTPDLLRRRRRALDAADAKLDIGANDAAGQLLKLAHEAPPDEISSARIELLQTQLALVSGQAATAPDILLASAQRLAQVNPALSRATYLRALMAAVHAGRLATDQRSTPAAVATMARDAPASAVPPTAVDMLLDGLTIRLSEGPRAAAPLLRRAIDEYLREEAIGTADPRWHDTTHRISLDLFDRETYSYLAGRQLESLRAAGALTVLPTALLTNASLVVTKGKFDEAAALLEEANSIVTATTGLPLPATGVHCHLEAYLGQEDRCRGVIQSTLRRATAGGQGSEVAGALHAEAVLLNGLGRHQEALAAATAAAGFDDIAMCGVALIELVEAAALCDELDAATTALHRLLERTSPSPTHYSQAVAARCTAMVTEGVGADELYNNAITHLQQCNDAMVQLPRTHLLYGQWLRRQDRLDDAREQLRIANAMFTSIGAEGFAQRARRELRAAGETVYTGTPPSATALTPQELQIATLARNGQTNSEIGGTLFLSPRTVEWHLGRIYLKLNITSRRQLRTTSFDRH